jgi:hypothetical protein
MAAMRVPLWLKIGWTVWVIAWVPFYWKQYGLQNFLFFCDLGNLFLDRRGWLYQTLTAWVVVPVNYFWRPQFDVNWARGPFFREQHVMPGLLYLLGYLVVVPLVVYFPTHLLLQWWARRGGFLLAGGRGDVHDVKPVW